MRWGRKQLAGLLFTGVLFGGGILTAASAPESNTLQPVATIAVVAGFAMGYATIGWIVIPSETDTQT